MPENNKTLPFSETHHAVLFGLIAKETIQRFGPVEGETCIRKAIRRYGEQRGKRMAKRAQADGQELSMTNYQIYGEWLPSDPTRMQSQMKETPPDLRARVTVCPWNDAWRKYDLLQYGRLYCQGIDAALVKGFNPELSIEVGKTLSNQGEPCEFTYCNASLAHQDTIRVIEERRAASGGKHTMPWDYHCGHLYTTARQVLGEDFGESGVEAARVALEAFAARFGEGMAQVVLSSYR